MKFDPSFIDDVRTFSPSSEVGYDLHSHSNSVNSVNYHPDFFVIKCLQSMCRDNLFVL